MLRSSLITFYCHLIAAKVFVSECLHNVRLILGLLSGRLVHFPLENAAPPLGTKAAKKSRTNERTAAVSLLRREPTKPEEEMEEGRADLLFWGMLTVHGVFHR